MNLTNNVAAVLPSWQPNLDLPAFLPPNAMLLEMDRSLLNTSKFEEEGAFELQKISPYVFKSISASSVDGKRGIQGTTLKHRFLAAANTAFDKHYGFVLNPSHLFILISQQIALHVNQNSEALRYQFVKHEGKKELLLEIPYSPTTEEWAGIIESFQGQIAENTVPDTKDLLTLHDFESAEIVEKVVGDVALMDICQSYFSYKMYTGCGFPYFVMEGPESDWTLLREKAEQAISRKTLPEFSSFWLSALLPTLDKLVLARKGEIDLPFWQSFYKRKSKGGSGGYTYVNGWINAFFPLTNDNEQNRFCLPYDQVITSPPDGTNIQDYTAGVSSVPVEWKRVTTIEPMSFCGGFVGGTIVNGNAIRPEVAWWVGIIDKEAEEKKKQRYSK